MKEKEKCIFIRMSFGTNEGQQKLELNMIDIAKEFFLSAAAKDKLSINKKKR